MRKIFNDIAFLPEKNRQAYANLPVAFIASIVNAVLLTYILWDVIPHYRLISWLVFLLTLTGLRFLTYLLFHKSDQTAASSTRWAYLYLIGLFLSGLVWGAAGVFLYPAESVGHQIFLAFVVGGMVAGSIASTSVLWIGFYLFSLPALFPIIVRFTLTPNEIHIGMGIMSMVFLLCCIFISRNFDSSTANLLELRFQNEKEIEQRKRIEKELIKHKSELEETVAERTRDLKQLNEELRLEIKERQNAENALKKSENKLKRVLDALPIGVWFTDSKGKIIYGNAAAQQIWQGVRYVEPDDFHLYKAWWKKTGEPISADQWGVARAIRNKEESHEEEIEIECFDGTHKIIQNWAIPILGMDGSLEGALAVNQDITEKISHEKERQKLQKLESVGTLAGGIAHDFNNILAAILGNINLACLDENLKDETKTLLNEAEKASLRARDLTHQLLTFSKGGSPVKETASLEKVIKDSGSFILSGEKVACHFDIPDDLWLVDIDRGQMSQVIQNVVQNAGHSMPEGGTVEIRCENILAETSGTNGIFSPEQKLVKISIEDNGIGMPQNMLDKIFDPYFSTKEKGRGLGLAITQSIVNKHNGYISVHSTPGKGTAFHIYLPASNGRETSLTEQHNEGAPYTARAKILIMDDEEMVRNVSLQMLLHLDHEVVLSADGEEAIQRYKEALDSGDAFDLVIMDLTIPGGMGGKEAVARILEIHPQAKVIVASGYSNDPVMANFSQYGFCAAMVKPFQVEDLARTIQQVLS